MTDTTVAIIYFSGYGHTARVADALADGVREAGAEAQMIRIPEDGLLDDAAWGQIEAADALVYGTPTYMGGPAWQFKRFADASSKLWFVRGLAGKIAGGFTVSASTNGDKGQTMNWLMTLSQQHGQIWAGPGMLPSNSLASGPEDVNWSGSSIGLMAIAPSDSSPEQGPRRGDLETARLYGLRLAGLAGRNLAAA